MRIVVTGGGTGGHIFPALAVCEGLRRRQPGCELLYIGSITGMESEIVPKTGVPYQAVTARKLRTVFSLSTVGVVLSLARGYQEARRYLRAYKPQVIVETGGYVAAVVALAAASLRIPTVVLAPDSIPGRTNRLVARYSRRICVVFEETIARFPAGKAVVTGLPLRAGVIAPAGIDPQQARCRFEALAPDRFTVLVIGGSQGARRINEIVVEALPDLTAAGMQVLHQTGPKHIADVQARARALGLPANAGYCPVAFLDAEQVPLAYRSADIIVCRGGISTLSEVMANGLPSVIIPLPTAYADHQTANAQALAKTGAALCYPDFDLHAEGLVRELTELKSTPDRLPRMAAASRGMARPDAADTVAGIVLNIE
jgi:UDP-N-acetylglucosamine--N-acetylmuramyl-(pentapeptide) pyrophosphoryl-undecaprenol N-acetylglucosamine transferase